MTAAETLYQQAFELSEQNPDSPQVLALLRQAAEQGHADAAFEISVIMLKAEQPDYPAVIPWLEIAAAQNHPYAAYNLLRVREILGTPFDRQLPQYAWLAENGMLAAQLNLLEYCADRHDPKAAYWAQRAAEHDHPFGHYFLALHHQLSGQPDLQRAREHYHHAAEQGLHIAHWQLGQIYRHGIGTAPDSGRAAHHLQQAAENGFIAAQTQLAELLSAQNKPEALSWYQTAADNGDDYARAKLAEHYLTGKLTARDPLKAVKHAKAAAEHRQAEALRLMGDIYRYGLGIKADLHTAQDYYRQAAEQGSLTAYHKLLSDAALHEPEQYSRIKTAALQQQHIEQTVRTAQAFHQGRTPHAPDHRRARLLYLEAAAAGHPEAAFGLGMIYRHGQGTAADPKQAAYWFEQAAEQGHAAAQYHLARQYYYGQGVPCHPETACRWLQAAIENGYENPQAFRYLLDKWRKESGLSSKPKPAKIQPPPLKKAV